jgi:hypothetical protein
MVERPGADSEEKHEPVSDIDTAVVDSLKALDLERPIREAVVKCSPARWLMGLRSITRRSEIAIFHDPC